MLTASQRDFRSPEKKRKAIPQLSHVVQSPGRCVRVRVCVCEGWGTTVSHNLKWQAANVKERENALNGTQHQAVAEIQQDLQF